MRKKLLFVLLVLAMALSLAPSVFAREACESHSLGDWVAGENGITVKECANCDYVEKIDTVAKLTDAISHSGLDTIKLDSSVTGTNTTVEISSDVTIVGVGTGTVTIKNLTFTVGANATLTLDNLTMDGTDGASSALITVNGGELVLNGTTLTNGKTAIDLKSGNVEMNGNSAVKNCSTGNDSAMIKISGGTFTMNGGEVSGSHYCTAILVDGATADAAKFIMNGGTITRNSADGMMGSLQIRKGTAELNGGSIKDNVGNAPGDRTAAIGGVMLIDGSLTINDGVEITGNLGAGVVDDGNFYNPKLTINGGTIKDNIDAKDPSFGTNVVGSADVIVIGADATITGGNIGTLFGKDELISWLRKVYRQSDEYQDNADDPEDELVVNLGFSSYSKLSEHRLSITGGYFSTDPSAYCAEGKTGIANTDSSTKQEYPYTVGTKSATAATVAATTAATQVEVADTITDDAKTMVDGVKNTLKETAAVTGTGIEVAAKEAANANTVTAKTGTEALEKAGVTTTGATVSIVVQTYLDVKVTGANATVGSKSLTLDITPMAQTVATTATGTQTIVTDGSGKNAVVVSEEPTKLDVTGPVQVSVPLPSGFVAGERGETKAVYVKHVKENGKTYIYNGTVSIADDGKQTLTFDNPHGFSSFEVSATDSAIAKINGIGYLSLQAAVDEVENNGTITLAGDVAVPNTENITVSKNITFTVANSTTTALRAGSSYTMTKTGNTYTFAYVAGSGATAKYAVSVTGSTGGTVTASEKRAAAGTEVVLTVTPDSGKTVAAVKVTDKNGKAVEVTESEDGTYSFTMPASKVTIKATFEDEATEEPETPETPEEPGDTTPTFTDVDKAQWYNTAIEYVVNKGIMEGYGDNQFGPNDTLTRGTLAQILYNAAGKPEVTGENPFTDVAADKWYATAITWAYEAGVVEGYDAVTFGPDDKITREQLATMLWRYAGKLEATQTSLSFTDASQVSSYAQEALLWATEKAIVQGKDNNVLDPTGTATRAEAATMVMRYLQLG
jgi:hypothetical protein